MQVVMEFLSVWAHEKQDIGEYLKKQICCTVLSKVGCSVYILLWVTWVDACTDGV